MAEIATDEEEVLFDGEVCDGGMEANESDGAHDDKVHVKAPECMEGDCEDVLFDAEEDSQSSCSESGELAAPEGMPLPVMGSTSLPFNVLAAAKYSCQVASQGSLESTPVPPHLRRLMWLRWLGVIRGQTPQDWLRELRPRREEFRKLAQAGNVEEKLRKLIRLDVARCFSESPRLACRAARTALRELLEVLVLRHSGEQPYCQGYHELAAVMLLVCMDGTWPADEDQEQEKIRRSSTPVSDDDIGVYKELGSAEAVAADALALLESLLYDHRLRDMYEPKPGGEAGEEEAVLAVRCRRITTSLRRVAPDLANEIESWGLSPHVLLLRWVRLLFLRELKFPRDVLIAWDAIFADAYICNSSEAVGPEMLGEGALPSSASFPLTDHLALAMIMAVPPTKPEEILQFSGRSPDVRRLLALAWQLRDFGLATKPRAESAGNFPQPPAACYPNLAGVRPQRTNEKDRRYTMGESLGGDVFGHAIGWAAARLSGAIEGVLGEEKRSDESRMNGRRSSDPIPRRPPKLSTPPSPLPGPPSRQTSFPVERETPPMSKLPSDAGDYGEASAQAPAAPVPIGRKPRDRGDTDSSWVLSPALSEISSVSQSQPRFNSLFSAAPAARAEHGVSDVQANARLRPGSEPVRNLLPFPRASRSEPEPSQAAERAGYQSEPFWAPLPEQEVRHAPAAESEPSASGIVKELDALQLMLNSLGKSQLLEGST